MEKLAIVVPCYNEEEVLKIASEALRGVLDDLIRKGKKLAGVLQPVYASGPGI
jgi:hypothetical protein